MTRLFVVLELDTEDYWIDSIWSTLELAEAREAKCNNNSPKLVHYCICSGYLDDCDKRFEIKP